MLTSDEMIAAIGLNIGAVRKLRRTFTTLGELPSAPTASPPSRSALVALPDTWTAQADDGAQRTHEWRTDHRQIVPVSQRSDEWLTRQALLQDSLPGSVLVALYRVENRDLFIKYCEKRDYIQRKEAARAVPLESSAAGSARSSKIMEAIFWHGTGSTSPEKIAMAEHGLDSRFASKGFYGKGVYLAEQAAYSDHSKYRHELRGRYGKRRQLLLVRAVIGRFKEYGRHTDRGLVLPPEDPSTGKLTYPILPL